MPMCNKVNSGFHLTAIPFHFIVSHVLLLVRVCSGRASGVQSLPNDNHFDEREVDIHSLVITLGTPNQSQTAIRC